MGAVVENPQIPGDIFLCQSGNLLPIIFSSSSELSKQIGPALADSCPNIPDGTVRIQRDIDGQFVERIQKVGVDQKAVVRLENVGGLHPVIQRMVTHV